MIPEATEATSAGTILEAIRALGPRIRAAAEQIETERRLPLALVSAMQGAGVFRMPMPRAWGGPEADPLTQIEVIEALSAADGSAGWCAMIGSDGGYFTAFLDDAVGRELYHDLDAVTASSFRPSGRAVEVAGGYRVTGRWAFASGCQHSTWFLPLCVVFDGEVPKQTADGAPERRVCFVRIDACEIVDTWTTTGLRGSGSHDVVVTDVFVPVERTFDLFTSPPRRPGALYALRTMFKVNAPGVPLGIARGAIDSVVALAAGKVGTYTGTGLREEAGVQQAVARADALVSGARGYVFDTVSDLWATLRAGDTPSPQQRARYGLCLAASCAWCAEAVDLMYQVAGGTALYAPHPLDRALRDILTLRQHAMFSPRVFETAGRMLLGLEPGTRTLF
jgi:indole-3-acetate monooxygenase